MIRLLAALLILTGASSASEAQVAPQPGAGDPRLQTIDYSEGQVVQLRGAPGYELLVELSPDERVENVAMGDTSAWQVSVAKEGNRLFLKPLVGGIATNMTVVTSVRNYNFDLLSSTQPSSDMPYAIRFQYPSSVAGADDGQFVDVSAVSRRLSRYKVSGDRALQPVQVSDDGSRTYIAWSKYVDIPAVYAIDRSGREVLVNGMMGTDDVFIVDGAPLSLAFRIDGRVAYARRINWKRKP